MKKKELNIINKPLTVHTTHPTANDSRDRRVKITEIRINIVAFCAFSQFIFNFLGFTNPKRKKKL